MQRTGLARQLSKHERDVEQGIQKHIFQFLKLELYPEKRRLIRSDLDVTFVIQLDHKPSWEILFYFSGTSSIRIRNLARIPNFGNENKGFIEKRNDD